MSEGRLGGARSGNPELEKRSVPGLREPGTGRQGSGNSRDGLVPTEIAAGDLNGDRVDDLAVANEGGNTLTVVLSNAAGGFHVPRRYAVGLSPSNVQIRDFTGDGANDVVDVDAGSNTISVLVNRGDGVLADAVSSPTNTAGSAAQTVADFNGDDRADVAVSHPAGAVAVNFGRGDGTFDPPATYPGPLGGIGIASGDFDGDGHPDIASVGGASPTQSVLMNTGAGTFEHKTVHIGTGAVCNRVADLNTDGAADVVSASADGHVGVLLGHGDGSFAPVRDYGTGSLYSSCFGVRPERRRSKRPRRRQHRRSVHVRAPGAW